MIRKKILFTAVICITAIFISCNFSVEGEGPSVSQERDLNNFSELEINIPANVTLVIADSFNVMLNAQQNILDIIITEIDGDVLEFDTDKSFDINKPVEVVISAPAFAAINITGSSNVKSLNTMKGEQLKLRINGSGVIHASAEVEDLHLQVNGSGDIYIKGSCRSNDIELNGSGNVFAKELYTAEAEVNINGSGDAELNVNELLDASIHGSGNIIYKGQPKVKTEIAGSGDIKKAK